MLSRRDLLLASVAAAVPPAFVRISKSDPRYFELSDGSPYIPLGNNICWERYLTGETAVLAKMQERYRTLAAHGGNFTRIWISAPFWDLEPKQAGVYEPGAARRLDALLDLARKHGIRVKLCLEHFRSLTYAPPRFPGSVSMSRPHFNRANGGPFADMTDYFTSPAGRELFLRKLDFYARRHRDDPAIFGWELWNEINAVQGKGWLEWTRAMLPEVKKRFPNHLAMQSLGSFDRPDKTGFYREVCRMPGNEVAQIHRYLDLGAELEVCRGPMDILAADAVRELLGYRIGRPAVLSEVGAVEPRHAGPWLLYEKDREGTLLHDLLFAPFFAGAAGPGQAWHWDHYIEKHDLWRHFRRFADAITGVDPRAEEFAPEFTERDQTRAYILTGRRTWLAWVRDARSDWRTELADGREPEVRRGVRLEIPAGGAVRFYDPWRGRWREGSRGVLPDFRRSLVVRVDRAAERKPTAS